MHDSEPDRDLRFGKVVVRPAARQLLVDGRVAPVGARAFDVLLALVERRDRVVGKDELLGLVWPGLVVEENNLQVQVSALRKALGADAIVTVPGRGYRFALTDDAGSAIGAAPADLPPRRRVPAGVWAVGGAAALAVVLLIGAWRLAPTVPVLPDMPLRSVVVAPFAAAPHDEALAAQAQRLAVDLAQALSNGMRHVQVAVAAEAGLGLATDAKTLGRAVNARFVLGGELRRDDGHVTVTLRLIDATDGRAAGQVLEKFDERRFADRAAMLRRVAPRARGLVAQAIANTVAGRGEAAADANDLVDLIGALTIRDMPAHAREARRLASGAIERNPTLARAWRARAAHGVTLFYTDFALDTDGLISEIDDDSYRAITLDPWDPMSWLVRHFALRIRGNFEGAFAALERVEELEPTSSGLAGWRGWLHLDIGRPEQALKAAAHLEEEHGHHHDPTALRLACVAHLYRGAYETAIATCSRIEVSFDVWVAHAVLAAAHAMLGDSAKAAEARHRLLQSVPTFTVSRYERRLAAETAPEAERQVREHFIEGLRRAGVPE